MDANGLGSHATLSSKCICDLILSGRRTAIAAFSAGLRQLIHSVLFVALLSFGSRLTYARKRQPKIGQLVTADREENSIDETGLVNATLYGKAARESRGNFFVEQITPHFAQCQVKRIDSKTN